MGNDIVIKEKSELLNSISNCIDSITNRDGKLKVLKSSDFEVIASDMQEIHRATNACGGKTQSQFMDHILTVSHPTPIRNLRQILSTIERSRGALAEARVKIERDYLELECKQDILRKIVEMSDTDIFEMKKIEIDIVELKSKILNSTQYIEGAFKKIYYLQQSYKDIMSKHNIKEDWNELDFEREEEEYHIKTAFTQAYMDTIASERIGVGNQTYFIQLGINPMTALIDINIYRKQENDKIKKMADSGMSPNLGIGSFYTFLNDVYMKYKGCIKDVLNHRGVNSKGYYDNVLYVENKGG